MGTRALLGEWRGAGVVTRDVVLSTMGQYTLRSRHFLNNRLLKRKQMILDVLHPNTGTPTKAEVAEQLSSLYKVRDTKMIFLFGFKTDYGGGKTTGFAFIYDTLDDARQVEPKFRLVRAGLAEQVESSRKMRRELKNKLKKLFGKKRL